MNRRDVKDADPRSSTFTEWPTPPLTRPVATGELKPGVKLQNEKKLAQNTNLFFSLYHSTAGTPAAVPKLSSAQISEHYSTCIKLSTENVSWYLRMLYFTFTFSHLADAYIQSDLQLGVHKAINLELLDFLLETLLLCVQLKCNSTITCCLFFLQKITTKNAFGLHLIDYMADILKQKDSELNFKVETSIIFIEHQFKCIIKSILYKINIVGGLI